MSGIDTRSFQAQFYQEQNCWAVSIVLNGHVAIASTADVSKVHINRQNTIKEEIHTSHKN